MKRIENKPNQRKRPFQPKMLPGQTTIGFPSKKKASASQNSSSETNSAGQNSPLSTVSAPLSTVSTPMSTVSAPMSTVSAPLPVSFPVSLPAVRADADSDQNSPASTAVAAVSLHCKTVSPSDIRVSDAELTDEDKSVLTTPRTRMTSDLLDKVMAKRHAPHVQVFKSTYAYALANFGGTEVVEQIGADPASLYLFPVCDDTHWVLVAFAGLGTETPTAVVLNSLEGNELGGLVARFVARVSEAYATHIETVRPRLPQQAAGSEDCGFFVAYYAHELIKAPVSDQAHTELFWTDTVRAPDGVREYVRLLFTDALGSEPRRQTDALDSEPRRQTDALSGSKPRRRKAVRTTGERAELLKLAREKSRPKQEAFFGLTHSWHSDVQDMFGVVSKPDVADVQMGCPCFEASCQEDIEEATRYVLFSLCSRKTLTNGTDIACFGPPPNHATPAWVAKDGPHHVVRYRLDGVEYKRKLLHVAARSNRRMDEDEIQISHLCHEFWCYNPLHVTLESGGENVARNACGPDAGCQHIPRCTISGADRFNTEWDRLHTRAQVLAEMKPMEVEDEVFPPYEPEPIGLQASSEVLRGDIAGVVKRTLYLLCARGAEEDVLGRELNCFMPPSIRGAPRWLFMDGQHPSAHYFDVASFTVKTAWLTRLEFFGTPEFEQESSQVSHLCHHWRCHNPEHVRLESNALNMARNNCAPEVCEHTPKCMVMGTDFFRTSQKLSKYGIVYEAKPFNCPECNMVHRHASVFEDHFLTHGERKFPCPLCPAKFVQQRTLDSHVVLHSNERPYRCTKCPETFKDPSVLKKHMKNAHDKFEWLVCDKCGYHSKHEWRYDNHLKTHEESYEGTPFQCNECGKFLSSKHRLADHLKVHEKFFCDECDREFDLSVRTSHMRVHTDGYKPCLDCGKGFKDESTLKVHCNNFHRNPKGFKCEIDGCSEKFDTNATLWKHKQRVHFNIEYRCQKCGRVYADKHSLLNHVCRPNAHYVSEAEHGEQGELQCPQCPRKVASHIYESHLKVHTQDFFECEKCGAGIQTKGGLKEHLLTHDDPYRFRCKVEGCSAEFTNSTQLRNHEKEVHEKYMVECTGCGRAFLNSEDLGRHECTGYAEEVAGRKKGAKVYYGVFCKTCDKEVLNKHLESHTKVHTEGFKECKECGLGLKNEASLAVHRRRHAKKAE